MTTFYDFTPNNLSSPPFSFQTTLDGQPYIVSCAWNVFGQRWYFTISDVNNNPVVTRPLTGSTTALSLTSLVWENGMVTGTWINYDLAYPLPFILGGFANLTIAGCSPDVYNGTFLCLFSAPNTFQYKYSFADPGNITTLGTVVYNINLLQGYFQTSAMVFRTENQQFEVSP
jgi:hypothetical protein